MRDLLHSTPTAHSQPSQEFNVKALSNIALCLSTLRVDELKLRSNVCQWRRFTLHRTDGEKMYILKNWFLF